MSFISPSMEAEMAQAASAKAEKELAEKNAKATATINQTRQGIETGQQLASLAQNPSANTAMAIAGNAAAMAGGKTAANTAKAQQVMQAAQMINGLSGGSGSLNAAAANGSAAPSQPPSGVAAVASSLLPVKVVCEVNINNNIISPILSLQVSQVLGSHNKMILRFHHDLVQDFGTLLLEEKAQSLLGNVVELILKNVNNPDGDKLEDTFVITAVELEEEALAEGIITLICHSPSWVLDSSPHYQSFYQKPLKKIAETICKPRANVKGKLLADPSFTDTVVYASCFNESHWNFLKRIASETGQWLYNSGKGLVFGKPATDKPFKLVYGQNCFHVSMGIKASAVQTGLFDYEAGSHNFLKEKANDYTGNIGSYAKDAFDKSKRLFTAVAHTGSSSMQADKSLLEVMGKVRSASNAAGSYALKGSSTVYGLSVGALATVEFKRLGQTAQHSDIRIVSVQHHYTAGGKYENSFTAVLSTAEFPPPIGYVHPLTHPMLAQVTDNKDPKNQGRVKVKFFGWVQEDEQTTDWIGVLTPDAGKSSDVSQNRGIVFIPEIEDQVMIDFESGNPEKPFITGSAFSGLTGKGGSANNKTKSITTRSKVSITFDDEKGSLTLTDKGKESITLDGNGNIAVSAASTISLTCGKASITLKSDGTIDVTGVNVTVTGSTNATMVSGPASFSATSQGGVAAVEGTDSSVNGTATTTISSTSKTHVTSAGPTSIEGAIVKLN